MKLCPICGEVFSDQSTECWAHGVELIDWGEVSDSHPGVDTTLAEDTGPFSDTAPFAGGDLTDPELPVHVPPTPPGNVVVDAAELVEQPRPARVLGDRYRLAEPIGIGGYGVVFDAYDQRLDKRVAVKVLSPAVAQDPETMHRFKREAIAASRVRHECIVDVTDYQVDPEGTSFIVMEYLGGSDLGAVIADDGPLAPARALAIAAQCASALTAAHGAGILHRDLKPSNLFLVGSASRPDFVKIIDFGISKVCNEDGQYSDVTSASKVVGTPFYMAPEQARGQKLDGRADVYALGVILFEMLTDERPFVGASSLEILTNAMTRERIPPSSLRPELAEIPGLDRLVLRAIAADRGHRFGSMQEFGEAITACLAEVDSTRALGLPPIAHQPEPARSTSARSPEARSATELVDPSTLESSSGQVATVRRSAASRVVAMALGVVMVAAVVVLFWISRSANRDRERRTGEQPAAVPASAAPTAAPPSSADARPPAVATLESGDRATGGVPLPDSEPARADAAPARGPYTVRVTSSPSGAVVSSRLRGRLGVTPLEVTLAADQDRDELSLSHPGRVDRTVSIDRSSEAEIEVELAARRAPRPHEATPPEPKPASPGIGIEEW